MTTMTLHHTAVRANTRTRAGGFLRYVGGRIAPRVFGAPLHVQVELRGPDGRVKKRRRVFNSVTTAGKQGIADQILTTPSLAKPSHMAVGSGTGGTTSLSTEVDRNAFTGGTATRAGAVVTFVGDWAAGDGTGALTEAGVFTAAAAGQMWLYTTFSVVNKGAADALTITWTLTIS